MSGLLWVDAATAHPTHSSYCSVRTEPGGLDVTLQVPLPRLVETSDASRQPINDEWITTEGARLRREVETHLRAQTPVGPCARRITGPSIEGKAERRAVFEVDVRCPSGPITLSLNYRFDVDPLADLVCAIDDHAHVFRPGAESLLIEPSPSLGRTLLAFVELGVTHVLGGIDHLLFVASLLLGATSASRGSLRRVIGLVTGFTLGHSITLLLAGLGVLSLPERFTESMIALSIAVVAAHNLASRAPRYRALVSALFGLIHGFGFAAALAEVGLPRRHAVSALLAFNIGVEIAQVAVVVLCFPGLLYASRRPWFRRGLVIPASALTMIMATLWLIERALGASLLPALRG